MRLSQFCKDELQAEYSFTCQYIAKKYMRLKTKQKQQQQQRKTGSR